MSGHNADVRWFESLHIKDVSLVGRRDRQDFLHTALALGIVSGTEAVSAGGDARLRGCDVETSFRALSAHMSPASNLP